MTRASDLAKLLGAGATILDGTTISTADNTTQLTLTSTDADSSIGPVLDLVRDSASPADGDGIGQIKFIADNDAGEATTYSTAFTTLRDASNGAEDGQTINYVMTGGALVDHLRMGRGSANGQSEVVVNEGSVDIDFRVESNGNANMLFVDGGNNAVGIGTNSPTRKLSIYDATTPYMALYDGSSGTTISDGFQVQFASSNAYLWNYENGFTAFGTNANERMRITSTNVGINTSSPTSGYMLHVGGSSGVHTKVKIEATTATGQAELDLSADPAGVSYLNLGDENSYNIGYLGYFHSDNSMRFQTNSAERMRIDSSGNLLVGATSSNAGAFGAVSPQILVAGTIPQVALHETDTDKDGYIGIASSTMFIQTADAIPIRFGTSDAERMRIDSSGKVYINTTVDQITSGAKLIVAGRIECVGTNTNAMEILRTDAGTIINFRKSGGSIVGTIAHNNTNVSYNTSSDHRLKENVSYDFDATTRLKQLRPARFNFIADADTTVDGFLAHEVQSVVPEAITGTHNEVDADDNPIYQGIDQSKLVPLLVKTIQELEARITALEGA
jgi:hypothetical protein